MAGEVVDLLVRARMEVSGVEAGVGQIQKALKGLSLPKGISDDLEKSFSKLNPLLKDYQKQLNKGFSSKKDLQNFNALKTKIDEVFGEIGSKIQQVNSQQIRLKVDTKDIDKLSTKITEKTNQLTKALDSVFNKKINTSNITSELDKAVSTMSKAKSLNPMAQMAKDLFKSQDYAGYNSQIDKMRDKVLSLGKSKFDFAKALGLKDAEKDIAGTNAKVTKFFNDLKVNEGKVQSINRMRQELQGLNQEAAKLKLDAAARGAEALSRAGAGIGNLRNNLQSVSTGAQQAASGLLTAKEQVNQLKYSTQYFFSLRNMFSLLRRGIDEAVQSVRDLDKAMTETAVVTDFKVSDMWNMLPEYTQLANKLGATTQGAYETMTLYFQQGLDKQATFEIGEETMKMARIAGLDYAQTTNMMTAALRGFNMELNKTSAQKVNDVYSKLAAITASDTRELGLAMERTASIAHSADMDFGNTTAFLAQMIETTREAPENLGTAMKTIIARFQELKKSPEEIMDVEGEEVSFNRIDTALKTIGVDLMDNKDKFRDLDDVFMDIAAKWDSLTQTQQRYIATTAAGSRQQSRFLAMMQNYSRLKELTDAAANSEGASQKQFEKTLDSFESKINKLKNAWQRFTMGIANNQFIKGAVDGITSILTVTSNLIDTLSVGSGTIKSFLSLMTAFAGLKVGGRVINGLVGALGGVVDPTIGFTAGLKGGLTGNRNAHNGALAAQIYSPIVTELRAIRQIQSQQLNQNIRQSAKTGLNQNDSYNRYNQFKKSKAGIEALGSGRHSVKELEKQLEGVSGKEQNLLMRSNSATFRAATNAIMQNYVTKGAGKREFAGIKSAERLLNESRAAGEITAQQYYKALQDPALLSRALQQSNINGKYNPAIQYLNSLAAPMKSLAKQMTDQDIEKIWGRHNALKGQLGDKYTRTDADVKAMIDKARASRENTYYQNLLKGKQEREDIGFSVSKFGKALNGIGKVGSGIASAGMGIQAFASLLVSSANPAIAAFGSALSSLGGLVSGLGMAVSGLSSGFNAIANSKLMTSAVTNMFGPAAAAAGGAATALTGGLMALVAAVGFAIVAYKKHNENIENAAKELTEKYKKNSDEVASNISNLESYKGDYARLSQGVDRNGMNVNLGDSDYARYLEIIDKIAELNPDIVAGYNEQGHAIIRNNDALQKTLDLEKQRQRQLVSDYTSDNSIQTLKAARDLQKVTKKVEQIGSGYISPREYTPEKQEKEFMPQAAMREQAQQAGKIWKEGIRKGWASEGLLKDFGIDANKLYQGDSEAVAAFDKYASQISSRLTTAMSAAGSDVSDDTKENFANIMSEFQNASDEMSELITPMYEQLVAKMSQTSAYKDIPKEMVPYFNQGLKEIASNANLSTKEINDSATALAGKFANLTSESSDYASIMDKINHAQEEFANTHNESDYDKAAATAVENLKELKSQYDTSTGYGKALAEFLDNQIAQIQSFTEEGVMTVSEALNTMTDEISAAEGALENFNAVAEGSNYSTAADNMKEIYDSITETDDNGFNKHAAGKGDQTYWAGAESLLGRDNLKNKAKNEVDKMLKTIEPMLQEGQAGFDAFTSHWFEAFDAGKLKDLIGNGLEVYEDTGWFKSIDENVNPQIYEQIASALGMSEDFLISMLNKGRQFADIDFANLQQVREALATSSSLITGAASSTKNGKVGYFVKEETLNAELSAAGITDVNKQEEKKAQLKAEQNIDIIGKASETGIKKFTDMGITSQKSLIETLGKTGEFTKEEIRGYAEQYAKVDSDKDRGFNLDQFDKDYDAYLKANDDQLSTLTSIDSAVATIAAAVLRDSIKNGQLNDPHAYESWKALVGNKGADTEAQMFTKGKNVNGELLSNEEYEKGKNNLNEYIAKGEDYVQLLKEGLKNAKTDAEKEKYQQEIDAFENEIIPKAKEYLDLGIKAHTENIQKQNVLQAERQGAEKTVEQSKDLSKAYNETAIDENNKLDVSKLNNLLGSLDTNKVTGTEKDNVIGQYLQNNSRILDQQGANNQQIAASIQSAAQEMAKNQMKPDDIAAAINQGYGTNLTGKDITTDQGTVKVNLDQQDLQTQLSDLQANVTATITGINMAATGQNNPNSAFRRTGTMARGSRRGYTIPGRPTLMGEEGEEVVWEPKRNEAYIVGSNGPQFGNISKNAVVWNAQQTKKIKKNSKTVGGLGTGARGITPIGTMKGGNAGSGAGGGGKKIPGMLSIDAIATIKEVIPPTPMAEIPVKGKLEIEGSESGGITNKIKGLFGGGEKGGPSIKASIEATSIKASEDTSVKVTGIITKFNNEAGDVKDVKAIATVTKVVKNEQVTGEPVKVQATASVNTKTTQPKQQKGTNTTNTVTTQAKTTGQSKVTTLASTINNLKNKAVSIAARVSGASQVNSLKNTINNLKNKTVTVTYKQNGKPGGGAAGINNHIQHHMSPSFAGSMAKGSKRHGVLGPNGRGGLTLTGEKGYEIAWLPSENRSMILGVQGPQMLNLPRDAVVYTHEQSKKILKKNQTIEAGSHYAYSSNISRNNSSNSSNKSNNTTTKNVNKAAKTVSKAATDTTKTIGYVSVWWENIARKTEITQRKMDSALKAFEKFTKEMSATLHKTGESLASGGGGGDDYLDAITKYMGYNQAQVDKANSELTELITSTDRQIQAWKTKTGKDDKKANKAAYNAGRANVTKISYKKGKKTKDEYVNLSPYIKEENGTYVIDQNKINAIGNVDKRKAVAEAANKEINDRLSKKYAAEDNIQKAQEAIEKMAEELYNTFFAWENELTKIWNLTKKIEATENNISRNKEFQDTLSKQLATGFANPKDSNYRNKTMEAFKQGLQESTDKIKDQVKLVEEQKDALQRTLNIEDERATLASVQEKLNARYKLDEETNKAKTVLDSANANLSSAQQRKTNAQNRINTLTKQKKKATKKSKKNQIQKQIDAAKKDLAQANSDISYYQQQVNNATAAYNKAVAAATQNLSNTEKLAYEEYAKKLNDTIEAQTAAQKYLNITRNADGTVKVEFDTTTFEEDKLKGLFTEERGKAIQEYVKEITETNAELSDAYKNANASVNELYDELSQLQDEWADYANELWDISEAETKKEIDIAKNLSSAITDALKNLLDEVKNKLDERRKKEDNAKTERDISQKQQRLAALRADTTGGNQVEIAQLEKEIADAQQDYQRSLEDQLLDRLQQQADLAAEQRERQIEIQEAISEGVNNAALVDLWMSDPQAYYDEMYEAYKTANEYDKKPEALRDQLDSKFDELYTGLTTNQDKQTEVVNAIDSIQSVIEQLARSLMLMTTDITNAKENGLSLTEAQDLLGASFKDLVEQGGYTLEDFVTSGISYANTRSVFSLDQLKENEFYSADAQKELVDTAKANLDKAWNSYYYSNKSSVDAFNKAKTEAEKLGIDTSGYNTNTKTQQQKNAEAAEAERKRKEAEAAAQRAWNAKVQAYNDAITAAHKKKTVTKGTLADAINKGAAIGYNAATVAKALAGGDGSGGVTWEEVAKAAKKAGYSRTTVASWSPNSNALKKATTASKWKSYKQGGLANFTGPAWLDGTPSKPELVLNAADTKNFLTLRDVLSKAIGSTSSVDNSVGDASFEININVDHINNDYDVDRIAERVKKDIVKSAGYRNVTQVRNFK